MSYTTTPVACYVFTRSELSDLLAEAVSLTIEYRDRHGYQEGDAALHGVAEVLSGLDAQDELYGWGECEKTHTLHARAAETALLAREREVAR